MRAKNDPRPTVLLTGFGPFPGVAVNASSDLVRAAAQIAGLTFPSFRFVAAVLPTEWRRAPELISELHDVFRPTVALHFGVAAGTQGIRLETRAENICRASLDAAGLLPDAEALCVDGQAVRDVTVDVAAIAAALAAGGWTCEISNDAGGYLCNAVFYQSLASAKSRRGAYTGFVHIPAEFSDPSFTLSDAVAAALVIIAETVHLAGAHTATAPSV